MMQVNIMIPLFTVPQGAAHSKIVEQITKITGFQHIKLFSISPYSLNKFSKKQVQPEDEVKKLVAQVSDFNLNFSELSIITQKYKQLQRQNNMLRNDLADFYGRYQQNVIKKKLKAVAEDRMQQKTSLKTQITNQNHRKVYEVIQNIEKQEEQNNSEQIQQFQKQIKSLVSQKRSKEQIIQKLTLYCECLLKIIEQKKISIF